MDAKDEAEAVEMLKAAGLAAPEWTVRPEGAPEPVEWTDEMKRKFERELAKRLKRPR